MEARHIIFAIMVLLAGLAGVGYLLLAQPELPLPSGQHAGGAGPGAGGDSGKSGAGVAGDGSNTREDAGALQTEEAASLQGKVLTAGGQAVEGAAIFLDEVPRQKSGLKKPPGETDADGVFYIDPLPVGATTVWVVAPDQAMVSQEVVLEQGENYVEVRLEPGGALEGVVSSAGNAIEGAMVTVRGANLYYERHMETDVRGFYRMEGLPEGAATVTAVISSETGRRAGSIEVTIFKRRNTRGDIVLDGGNAALEGFVTINGDAPELNGHVSLKMEGQPTPYLVELNEEGYFRLDWLPAGAGVLTTTLQATMQGSRVVPVQLRLNETTRVDIEMNAGVTVLGTVQNMGNQSAQVALIEGVEALPTYSNEFWNVLSDYTAGATSVSPQGTFQLPPVNPGIYTIVAVASASFEGPEAARMTSEVIELGESEEVRIELTLP